VPNPLVSRRDRLRRSPRESPRRSRRVNLQGSRRVSLLHVLQLNRQRSLLRCLLRDHQCSRLRFRRDSQVPNPL
jgi:hypothetical protein